MKIERVLIRDLRALSARDDLLVGPDGVYPSACLQGLNGSGKTTYLEAIAQLWQWFRRCTQRRAYASPAHGSVLHKAGLVAVLFTDMPGPRPRMWVAFGQAKLVREHMADKDDCPLTVSKDGFIWDEAVLKWWDEAYASAESGGELVPNVVMIEAENKFVPQFKRDDRYPSVVAPSFVPVARHLSNARGPSHLEGVMRALYLARRERWATLASEFARLRPGMTLLDEFELETQRPQFKTRSGSIITADLLSAGERSVLINLCMVLRWLGPGGLVLLDEPELHQHISLMRGSVAVIEALVTREFGGQLLVASHAPEVWAHFRISGAMVDLDA